MARVLLPSATTISKLSQSRKYDDSDSSTFDKYFDAALKVLDQTINTTGNESSFAPFVKSQAFEDKFGVCSFYLNYLTWVRNGRICTPDAIGEDNNGNVIIFE